MRYAFGGPVRNFTAALALAALLPCSAALAKPSKQTVLSPQAAAAAALSFADLVDLGEAARAVAVVDVRSVAVLKPGQGGVARPGFALAFVTGRTRTLLIGDGVGESLRYLVEVPLDARGKAVKPKGPAIVFGNLVPGRPGELRLAAPDAHLAWSAPLESRVRAALTELVDPAAVPRVRGLRDVIHVPGNLSGEGETQIFVTTARDPIAISVIRTPGTAPRWGVSLGDVIDPAARHPDPDTLLWYRLACFLPRTVPADADLSANAEDRALAAEDYALVRRDLGVCGRKRG